MQITLISNRAGLLSVPRFSCRSTPIGIISTPQAIGISQLNKTLQNSIYLALEIKNSMQDETQSKSDSGHMKAVADYRDRIY